MCNPPFFSSIDEKSIREDTSCIATQYELVTHGGELEFVKKLANESVVLMNKVIWFTSLIGRKVNLKKIKKHLGQLVPRPYVIEQTEFKPGKTARWAIAWTFDKYASDSLISKKKQLAPEKLLEKASYVYILSQNDPPIDEIANFLKSQSIPYQFDPSHFQYSITVYKTTPWLTNNIKSETECSVIGPEFPPAIFFRMEISISRGSQRNQYIMRYKLSQESEDRLLSLHWFGKLSGEINEILANKA